jgi:hypothetical protein
VTRVDWVSIVALTGWLVLAFSAYRAQRVGARKTLVMALAWGAIFLLVTAIFAAIGR